MGVLKFPGHPGSYVTQPRHGHGRDTHHEVLDDVITEVPAPEAPGKSRSRKRLSPAAVIARSLAPDAQHLTPTGIIARSLENAFGRPEVGPDTPSETHYAFRAEFRSQRSTHTHRQSAPAAPPPPSFPIPNRAPPEPAPAGPAPFADFWNVWLKHHDYLFKQSLRFTAGNMADAEDALSQAMLKGSQHFDSETIRNERAWFTRLVHNACMDQHRSRKRQSRLSDEIDGDDPDQAPNITPRPMRTPDEALHMRQTFDQLENQLLNLPISLLEPLLLRVIEEKSYDEIAGRMGLSNCAVRKRIQLARDRLRQTSLI